MELLFFPPVAILTLLHPLAPFFIACDESATLPVFTEFSLVAEEVRFASEVLEVMGVDALGFVVVMVEGTPLCFEVEYEEVKVLILRQNMVHESHLDVFH